MKMIKKYSLIISIITMLIISSCQQPEGNQTGSEYMPDMAHSIAYESNHYLYYYNNTWGSEEDYYEFAKPRLPVKGTVPRGQAGAALKGGEVKASSANEITIPMNGSVPYYYEDSDEGRAKATAELVNNPYQITDAGLEKGEELYDVFCGICHGDKGDGNGYLVRDDGGVYPVQPANLINEEFTAASNGRLYHAIVYGKNLMGSYADKMSYEERWQVVHYLRSLQAKEYKAEYNQLINTLNAIDVPAGEIEEVTIAEDVMESHEEGGHHTDVHHGSGDDHHSTENHGDDH